MDGHIIIPVFHCSFSVYCISAEYATNMKMTEMQSVWTHGCTSRYRSVEQLSSSAHTSCADQVLGIIHLTIEHIMLDILSSATVSIQYTLIDTFQTINQTNN